METSGKERKRERKYIRGLYQSAAGAGGLGNICIIIFMLLRRLFAASYITSISDSNTLTRLRASHFIQSPFKPRIEFSSSSLSFFVYFISTVNIAESFQKI